MRLNNWLVVLMVALGLAFAGCKAKEEEKKEEAKKEEAKKEEPKAEEPKAEEPKAEEPKAEEPKAEEPKAEEPAAEEPKAEEPKAEEPKAEVATEGLGAKETVEAVFKSIQAKNLAPIVGLFPAKYIADIDGLVQDFAKAMDAELWNKGVALLDKTFKVAVAQKDGLAQMAAGMGIPVQADDVKKAIDALAETWAMMKEMGLTDIEKLKTFSLAEFAKAGLDPRGRDPEGPDAGRHGADRGRPGQGPRDRAEREVGRNRQGRDQLRRRDRDGQDGPGGRQVGSAGNGRGLGRGHCRGEGRHQGDGRGAAQPWTRSRRAATSPRCRPSAA